MLILGIDSAGSGCGVSVWRDGTVLASAREAMERGQDRRLLPLILEVMKKADVDFAALDRIAVTRGPGSFTGIRIGLAAARGIGLAAGKPVCGIDRFAIYRAQVNTSGKNLLVIIDSRRKEPYCRFYPDNGPAAEPVMMTPDQIASFLKDKEDTIMAGDAVLSGAEILKPVEDETVTAAAIAACADPADAVFLPRPLYIRPPDVTLRKGTHTIRAIQENDITILSHLHGESFGTACWNEQQMKSSLDLPTTRGWVAMIGDKPAGFILCQIAPEQSEVLTFCVSVAQRRRGIGESLLKYAIDIISAQGSTLLLEAAADNKAARGLYEKLGFVATGARANYYRRGTDTIDAVLYALKSPSAALLPSAEESSAM